MTDLASSLTDKLAPFGPVTVRKMFGGHGVFYQGLMFGLIADPDLYLKVDDQCMDVFKQAGSTQFMYEKGDRVVGMSYYLAPAQMFEDDARLVYWCTLAYDAAVRSKPKGKKLKR